MIESSVSIIYVSKLDLVVGVLTHLLGDHNDAGSLRSTTDARDSEKFIAAREKVVCLRKPSLYLQLVLVVQLSLNVVNISCSLQRAVSKSDK